MLYVTDTEVGSVCDGSTLYLVPGDHGFLTSPDYPDHPTTPHTCAKHMVTSHGAEIDVTIFHVNLPDMNACTENHVTLSKSPDDVNLDDVDPDDLVVTLCEDVTQTLALAGLRNVTVLYGTDGQAGGFGYANVPMAKGFTMEYTGRYFKAKRNKGDFRPLDPTEHTDPKHFFYQSLTI